MRDVPFPLTFRSEETARVFSYLKAGDSCQVVGIGSSGKSNFAHFLLQEDIRRHYLGAECDRTLFIYIDSNKLLRRDDWGLSELMLHQILVNLSVRGIDERILHQVDDLHQRAADKVTEHLALRYLDRALALICSVAGLSTIFLFDEFDDLGHSLPAYCFAALRAFRDEHKYQLMYITFTRRPLNALRESPSDIENFDELVSGHILWLMNYSNADARLMIRRIAERYNTDLNEEQIHRILHLTGNHPGLIRAAFRLSKRPENDIPWEEWVHHPTMQEECLQIWRSLPLDEQRALSQLINTAEITLDEGILARLKEKGLLGQLDIKGNRIFSILFEQFLKLNSPSVGKHVEIDVRHSKVWVLGKPVENLTMLEFHCLNYLVSHSWEACYREDIAKYIYKDVRQLTPIKKKGEPVDVDGDYNQSVDGVVKRLKGKIEVNPEMPRYIKTVRGVGYRFEDGVPPGK